MACRLVIGMILLQLPIAAHARTFAAGVRLGAGYVPLSEWREFAEYVLNSSYDSDRLALFADVYGKASNGRHGLKANAGYIATSAHLTWVFVSMPLPGTVARVVDWDFSGFPLSLEYEFSLRENSVATPFFGGGPSVYYSHLRTHVRVPYASNPSFPIGPYTGEHDGWGYGFSGYIGQRAVITESLLLSAMLRARWADGMAFTDRDVDTSIHFTGVDLSLGLEWNF